MLCDVLQLLLGDDYEVTAAYSGRAAIGIISEGASFDAVLCDLSMPDISGPSFFAWLEEHQPALCSRVLFMTGGLVSAEAEAFARRVPNRFLHKPVAFDLVDAALRALLAE